MYDYEYWNQAPQPFYIFILIQVILLILLVRVPFSNILHKGAIYIVIVTSLITNTVGGMIWLINFRKEHENYLKTRYFVESIILLSIPIAIAAFFVLVFVIVVVIMLIEHRRHSRMQRLDEEG